MAEEQNGRMPSGKYSWRIDEFSEKHNEDYLCSETFPVGGCKWQILFFPMGDGATTDHISVFLQVADADELPSDWSIEAKYTLALVDQESGTRSVKYSYARKFKFDSLDWGSNEFMLRAEFLNCSNGYVVNNTVVVEAEISVKKVVPSVELATQINKLGTYLRSYSKFIASAGTPWSGDELSLDAPSADNVEKARQSLKECMLDLFKSDVRDKLSSALTILGHPRAGLSPQQHKCMQIFQGNFDMREFQTFDQYKSYFEQQKQARDDLCSTMKEDHENHVAYQSMLDSITEEKEELNKRLKELGTREAQIVYDWETLMNKSEVVKSRYAMQERKLVEAAEKLRIGYPDLPVHGPV